MKGKILSLALCLFLFAGVTACGENPSGETPAGAMEFSLALFDRAAEAEKGENLLLSPYSVTTALLMVANGAEGETKTQMMQILTDGGNLDGWNRNTSDLSARWKESEDVKVRVANGVWFRSGYVVPDDAFSDTVLQYYGAEVKAAPFDESTVSEINGWVKEQTQGKIDGILSQLKEEDRMVLVNALSFDGEWEEPYSEHNCSDGTFTTADRSVQDVEMMSDRLDSYLEMDGAVGFVKDYKGGEFKFVALLPEEGTDIYGFLAGLTAEELSDAVEDADGEVIARMPKFSCTYSADLEEVLAGLGLTELFDPDRADLSGMGISDRRLYVGGVLHKTMIRVDEKGTEAGAVTAVLVPGATSAPVKTPPEVVLDRPFIYLILAESSDLPLFMGILNSVE